jgi:signal transduction histidine kinase
MFSEPLSKTEVDEIFTTFKEPLDRTPKIDVIIEHYLSVVSQLKKDLNLLKEDLSEQRRIDGDMADSLEEFHYIQKLSVIIDQNWEPIRIYEYLKEIVQKLFPFRQSEIFLFDQENFAAVSGKSSNDFQLIIKCALEEGILKWLWEQGHPIVVPLTDFMVYDRLRRKKGNVIMVPVQQRGVFILLTEKEQSKFSVRDLELLNVITQQAGLAIQFQQLNQMVEKKNQDLKKLQSRLMALSKQATIGELAGGIAHEINNPLQIIMGNVQMARMGHRTEESLEVIEKQSLRIANIVRGLLNMARPNHDASNEYLEINPLIVNTLNLVRGQIEKRNIEIKLDLEKTLPITQCGSIFFQQILLNIILHAKMQIGQNGTINIISRSENREWVVIEVIDSGIPYPEEYIDRVMNPFMDLDHSSEANLGLTVSIQMVKDLGGEVRIDWEKKTGNRIRVKIPALKKKEDPVQQEVAS